MDTNVKGLVSRVCLMTLYITLSVLGLYYAIGLVLFPIIAIPSMIYFINNKIDIKQHLLFQVIVNIGIYLITGNFICILVYLVSVCIPTYIILYFYKEEFPLPNIIMYSTICLAIVVLAFFIVMKVLGIDFEAEYIYVLNHIKEVSTANIENILVMQNPHLTSSNIMELSIEMKQLIKSVIDAMQSLYSALIILQLLLAVGVSVIIGNVFLRRKNKGLPSLRELIDFKLSKVSLLILFISMMGLVSVSNENSSWALLSLNIVFVLMTLFQIIGVLALIGLLAKSGISKGIKITGYITVILLASILPNFVMIFGCLDTLFNYRKAKIVV